MATLATWYLVFNRYLASEKYATNHQLLINAFKKENINLVPIDNFKLNLTCSKQDEVRNVIFFDKDIYLCKKLENLGYHVFNSSRAIEICDSKMSTYLELAGKINMPQTFSIPKNYGKATKSDIYDFVLNVSHILGFPMVIKENYGSFGAQVYMAKDIETAVKICSEHNNCELLFQKFCSNSFGRDVRVYVVGNQAVFGVERTNPHDFRTNVLFGGNTRLITLSQKQIDIAQNACKILQLDFGGVDLLFDENNEPILCEVNSNCQFASSYDASNINLAEYIAKYLSQRCKIC